jgi:antigen flippase
LVAGELGQSAAVCYHVARDPRDARSYVATSRAIMLVTGTVALLAGVLVSPLLAHRLSALTMAYRVAFTGSVLAFIGTSYTFSLQARDIGRWNLVRMSQPVLALAGIVVLWRLRLLNLNTAVDVLIGSIGVQLGYAYHCCRLRELAPGRAQVRLVRPLVRYGLSQLAAVTPASINMQLDQLVLSQVVPAADQGRYAVAVSITLVPIPLVSAIGNVAFPRLAAQRTVTAQSHRLQLAAVLTSAGLAASILLPAAAVAYWVIPLVYGSGFRGAVPLIWILTPGGISLSCIQVAGDVLRGRNRQKLVAAAEGLAAVFTVVLLIVLLPLTGVAAAAIASTFAYGVAAAVMIGCLWRLPHEADATLASAAIHGRGPARPPGGRERPRRPRQKAKKRKRVRAHRKRKA